MDGETLSNIDQMLIGENWSAASGAGRIEIRGGHTRLPDLYQQYRRKEDIPPEIVEFREAVWDAKQLVAEALQHLAHTRSEEVKTKRAEQLRLLTSFFPEHQLGWREPIKNGYHATDPYWSCFPWYRVHTLRGPIVVGWRKHVIHIGWSESALAHVDGETFFPDRTGTRGKNSSPTDVTGCFIHADTPDEARQNIHRLLTFGAVAVRGEL